MHICFILVLIFGIWVFTFFCAGYIFVTTLEFVAAEWKKLRPIPKRNDADAAEEIPKLTVA